MKIILLFFSFAFFHLQLFSQDFIYFFEGTIDAALVSNLELKISKVTGIQECKVKLKEGTNYGEVFLTLSSVLDPTNVNEQFTPVDVKKILIENNLIPVQFIESK